MSKDKDDDGLDLFDWKSDLVEGIDFYWEGGKMVFTKAYLLRRGKCCGNGCKHCPFGFNQNSATPDKKKRM